MSERNPYFNAGESATNPVAVSYSIAMWLALTLSAFVCFLASIVAFIRLGFNAQGQWQPRGPKILALVLVSLLVWVVALTRVPPPYPLEQTKRWELPRAEAVVTNPKLPSSRVAVRRH